MMKAVERKGGVKRESRRSMRGVKSAKSMENSVPQMREGNTRNTRRRGDIIQTLNNISRFCEILSQLSMEISKFFVNHT